MTSFHDVRFPTLVARGSTGGPGFSTDIVTVSGGDEQRNENWQQERSRFDVSTGVRTREEAEAVLAFFRARKGRAYSFRFKDWLDYTASDQVMRQVEGPVYQLVKRYASGPVAYVRTITKPVAETVIVKVDGEEVDAVEIDLATGLVTFEEEPETAPTASFEFDVHCRFDVDSLALSMTSVELRTLPAIPIIEVRG